VYHAYLHVYDEYVNKCLIFYTQTSNVNSLLYTHVANTSINVAVHVTMVATKEVVKF